VDIAHATGNMCRYTGHTRYFYSVAEHQLLVSDLMEYLELGDPFEGLNHDDTESVLADIAAPLKVLLPDYKKIENGLDVSCREWLGLPTQMSEGCKRADWLALFIEAAELIPSGAKDWLGPPGVWDQAQELRSLFHIVGYDPQAAEHNWLTRFHELRARKV
jgi:hypothetical protein